MKIKLKNLIVNDSLNVKNPAFDAVLYINDIKVGTVSNSGENGGTTFKSTTKTERGRQLIKEAEGFFHDGPSLIKEDNHHKPIAVPMTLGAYIDSLWHARLSEMRMHRLIAEGVNLHTTRVLYGIPFKHYELLEYNVPIKKLLQSPDLLNTLQKDIESKIFPLYADGYRILTTNVPKDVLHKLGASPEHFKDIWGMGFQNSHDMKMRDKKLSKGWRL